MPIEVAPREGGQVVKVTGDVDLYTSPELRQTLMKAIGGARGPVYVDLSEVTYMDSSGVATLVEGLKTSGQKKVEYILLTPAQSVMKVLQLARLDAVFKIQETA